MARDSVVSSLVDSVSVIPIRVQGERGIADAELIRDDIKQLPNLSISGTSPLKLPRV